MSKQMPSHNGAGFDRIYRNLTRALLARLAYPLSVFASYESAANVRTAIKDAQTNEGPRGFYPTSATVHLVHSAVCRGKEAYEAIDNEKKRNDAARDAATFLMNSRVYWEQARNTVETIQPINYYYGGISFLEFITSCLVRRRDGEGSHGLHITFPSASKVARDWPGKCSVEMTPKGDFPFFVDALTVSGFPTLFSGYRLYRGNTAEPWVIVNNPCPLMAKTVSLAYLCNFDLERHGQENPGAEAFWKGSNFNGDAIIKLTELLLDFLIVYVASNIARYRIAAWREILDGEGGGVMGDIRTAYLSVAESLPYYFAIERPFSSSFKTAIA